MINLWPLPSGNNALPSELMTKLQEFLHYNFVAILKRDFNSYVYKTHLPKEENIHGEITPDKTLQSCSQLTPYMRSDCKIRLQEQANLKSIFDVRGV